MVLTGSQEEALQDKHLLPAILINFSEGSGAYQSNCGQGHCGRMADCSQLGMSVGQQLCRVAPGRFPCEDGSGGTGFFALLVFFARLSLFLSVLLLLLHVTSSCGEQFDYSLVACPAQLWCIEELWL